MNQTQVTNIVWSNVRQHLCCRCCMGPEVHCCCCAGRAGPVVGRRALRVPRRHRRPARAEPDRRRLDDRAADCERRAPPGPDVPDAGRSAVGGVCAAEGGGDDTALGAGALRRAAGPPRIIINARTYARYAQSARLRGAALGNTRPCAAAAGAPRRGPPDDPPPPPNPRLPLPDQDLGPHASSRSARRSINRSVPDKIRAKVY